MKNIAIIPARAGSKGGIYLIKSEILHHIDTLYLNKCYAFIMPRNRSIDIDTAFDFELAEFIMSKQ